MSLSKMPKDKIIRNMPLSKYEQGGGESTFKTLQNERKKISGSRKEEQVILTGCEPKTKERKKKVYNRKWKKRVFSHQPTIYEQLVKKILKIVLTQECVCFFQSTEKPNQYQRKDIFNFKTKCNYLDSKIASCFVTSSQGDFFF